jgi:iron complex outermembrane recepter protein
VSGPLFELPAAPSRWQPGVDWRRETYTFGGDTRPVEQQANPIIGAPFDNANALPGAKRIVKAAYGEVLVPLFDGFEITGALRLDDYTGFGTTTNPKIAAKYRPVRQVMFRGSYNTSFRVPGFNQIFNGVQENQYLGADIADPATCPGGRASSAPGCEAIQPIILNGGRTDLGPETSKQFSVGVVFEPVDRWFLSVDWWQIEREGTFRVLSILDETLPNADVFPELFIRDSAGTLLAIDNRWVNSGGTKTEGIEVSGRGGWDLWSGQWTVGLDGTYLLDKRTKVIKGEPYGPSEVARFTFAGDLGLRWKHNLFLTYARDDWSVSVSQIFRQGYENFQLPGVASGAISPPDVVDRTSDYVIYNMSASYRPFERLQITAGIKNLFDKDPPFAINYDSGFGSGSSWEPRVADPRGRSFTLLLDFKL